MNPMQYALNEIRQRIPLQLLQMGFPSLGTNFDNTVMSLDERIRSTVLEARVITDVNLLGGTEVNLPLSSATVDCVDDSTYVYRLDDRATQGRQVTQVFNLGYGPYGIYGNGAVGSYRNNTLNQMTQNINNASMGITPVATSHLSLIGHNTFMVRFPGVPSNYIGGDRTLWVRCRIADDGYLSSIRPNAYPTFGNLCVLAVKAYLYNNLAISIDEGAIRTGQVLGVIREMLWNMQEAEQLYQEARRDWQAVAVAQDPDQYRNFLRLQVRH